MLAHQGFGVSSLGRGTPFRNVQHGRRFNTGAGPARAAAMVLPASYTLPPVAKVMVSLPDDLLGALDAEAKRRHTSRSAILQTGARRELGLLRRERDAVLSELDGLSREWNGPLDAAGLVRAERLRDG